MEPQRDIIQQPQERPLLNYQFTPDELRVLQECNSESFFQRSLPLGTGLGLAAYFGVKNGFLQSNVKYGSIPKVSVAVIIGYFVGKFSYQQKCAEKIMRIPNSRLAEVLRQRRQGGGVISTMTPDQNLGRALTLAPFASNSADIYSDEGMQPPSSALNLDTEARPTISGLDDIYRPTLDTPATLEPELQLVPAKPGTTYDDLRKKNRDEYSNRQQNPYSRPLPPDAPVVIRQQPPQAPVFGSTEGYGDTISTQNGKKNKYGDTWTD